ncbi:MAG: hypothetical protein WBC19_08270 [Pyrinomonadaceae bacterium]
MIARFITRQPLRRSTILSARGHVMIRSALLAIGFLFCLLPQTARSQEWRNCMEPGYLAFFDYTDPGDPVRIEPQPCEVITTANIRWGTRSATLRAIHPTSMPINNREAIKRHIDQAAAAIGNSLERLEGNPNLGDITLLFTSYVSAEGDGPNGGFHKGDTRALTRPSPWSECAVTYYKDTLDDSGGNRFLFNLSHEVFHCVQYATWPGMPRDGWLVEATPNYFAYMVVPGYDPRYITTFDRDIPSFPINRLTYAAVPFYLWLGHAYGPPRVKAFLDNTRTILDAVSPDMLGEFAKAYFGKTIRMPDGRPMPSYPAAPATRTVNGSTRIASPVVEPYTVKSELITFARGNVYELSQLAGPADSRTAWRLEPDGAFGEMPATVSTCDGDKQFLVVRTTTTSKKASDINVTAQPASSNVCACPAGTWQETTASAKRYFEQKGLGIYAGSESTKYISGGRVLTLNPDHTGSLSYNNVETVTTGSSDLTVHQVKTGESRFTWRVANGKLLTFITGGNNLITLNNQLTTPNGTIYETKTAIAQSIGHEFVCDATGLHLRQIARPTGGIVDPRTGQVFGSPTTFNTNMDFVRIGGTP